MAYPEQAVHRRERVRDRQAVEQPVDGADAQGVAGCVDQEHQAVVPGARGGVFQAQPAVGGPAVVAVGDQGLAAGEVGLDAGQFIGVGDGPEAVPEAVLGGRGQQGRTVRRTLDDLGRGAVAPVGQQQRLQVRAGGPHEGRAVGDHGRHDVLVREHDTLRGLGDPQGADDAALEHAVAVPLLVDVEARLGAAVRMPSSSQRRSVSAACSVRALGVPAWGRISRTMLYGSADWRWCRPSGRTTTS